MMWTVYVFITDNLLKAICVQLWYVCQGQDHECGYIICNVMWICGMVCGFNVVMWNIMWNIIWNVMWICGM
jgi:hypothetical protein